jgi:signal transduction histidine kinase
MAFAVAGVLGGVIAIELFGPRYSYDNLHFFVALRTAEALIGLIAAFLFYGRYQRRERLDDLVLSTGFGILALNNLYFGAIPAVAGEDPSRLVIWGGTIGSLLGTASIALAAVLKPRRFALRRGQLIIAMALPFVLLGAIAAILAAVETEMPTAVVATFGGGDDPQLDAHWFIVISQALLFMLFMGIAVRLATRAGREQDQFFFWLAIGAVLAAAARLAYVFYPSLHSIVFSTGDALRLSFYLVVLFAAMREISSYWSSVANAAALEERRRVARDIHDVLAQEIASIGRNLRWLDDGDRFVQRARAAADRALLETRGALAALDEKPEQSLRDLVADVARKVAEREGVEVVVGAEGEVEVEAAQASALAMIVTEAITNAARHGGASVVRVQFANDGYISMRVADDGEGFDASGDGIGYGLGIMRDRAEAISAQLQVRSQPGSGTEIIVEL